MHLDNVEICRYPRTGGPRKANRPSQAHSLGKHLQAFSGGHAPPLLPTLTSYQPRSNKTFLDAARSHTAHCARGNSSKGNAHENVRSTASSARCSVGGMEGKKGAGRTMSQGGQVDSIRIDTDRGAWMKLARKLSMRVRVLSGGSSERSYYISRFSQF